MRKGEAEAEWEEEEQEQEDNLKYNSDVTKCIECYHCGKSLLQNLTTFFE